MNTKKINQPQKEPSDQEYLQNIIATLEKRKKQLLSEVKMINEQIRKVHSIHQKVMGYERKKK